MAAAAKLRPSLRGGRNGLGRQSPGAWHCERTPEEFGAPVETPAFAETHAQSRLQEESRLLEQLPQPRDLKRAETLLLYSVVPRVDLILRMVPLSHSAPYAQAHDKPLRECLSYLPAQRLPLGLPNLVFRVAMDNF